MATPRAPAVGLQRRAHGPCLERPHGGG